MWVSICFRCKIRADSLIEEQPEKELHLCLAHTRPAVWCCQSMLSEQTKCLDETAAPTLRDPVGLQGVAHSGAYHMRVLILQKKTCSQDNKTQVTVSV